MSDYANSAAFILTHGRPDNVITYDVLREAGWTRPVYFIVDDEDKTVPQYQNRYGKESVIIFSKEETEKKIDVADTLKDRRTILYARNASFDIAENLGIDYHIQLDDDYSYFRYRYVKNDTLSSHPIKQFDVLFDSMAAFLKTSNALSVALAQGGDFMGGADSALLNQRIKRKAMNSFIIKTDRRFKFIGRMNEDVNTYVTEGTRGQLFFTIVDVGLAQGATQSNEGGITDLYKTFGTYTKSFYTVMMAPSCTKISTMGRTSRRIHHQIQWNNATPKIISSKHQKK